jgi:hypothetical protein
MAHKWLVKATNHTFTRLLLLLHTKKRISSVQGAPVGIRFDRNKFKLTKEMQDHLFIRWGDFNEDDVEFIVEKFLNYWDSVPARDRYRKSWKITFYGFF